MASKVLVTGGTGYIGSHTVVELIQKGYEVVILDNLYNSSIEVIDYIFQITGKRPAFVEIDLCDKDKLKSFFAENQDIKAIIHFAAYKAVGESVEQPLKYFHNNFLSLINLLELMSVFNIRHFVFSSSCTVYGQPTELPVTEKSQADKASSPYGYTKQVGERIIADTLFAQKHLNAISLRYFNPIGAHESGLLGELPSGTPNNLMPFITQTAIGMQKNLKVFGYQYDTPDGTCIRDYIHVVDLAQAHIVAMERLLKGENENNWEYFNLGTGRGVSVLEVIQSFEKVSGLKLNYQLEGPRPGDVIKIYADTTLANQKLGWQAQKTLDDMTLSAWQWEQSYRTRLKN
jgi:UDP-glucose 4-epimerase